MGEALSELTARRPGKTCVSRYRHSRRCQATDSDCRASCARMPGWYRSRGAAGISHVRRLGDIDRGERDSFPLAGLADWLPVWLSHLVIVLSGGL